jgi:hypothetical protein
MFQYLHYFKYGSDVAIGSLINVDSTVGLTVNMMRVVSAVCL